MKRKKRKIKENRNLAQLKICRELMEGFIKRQKEINLLISFYDYLLRFCVYDHNYKL